MLDGIDDRAILSDSRAPRHGGVNMDIQRIDFDLRIIVQVHTNKTDPCIFLRGFAGYIHVTACMQTDSREHTFFFDRFLFHIYYSSDELISFSFASSFLTFFSNS